MRAKDYLSQLRILDERITETKQQLSELKEQSASPCSVDYSSVRVQEGTTTDSVAAAAIRIMTIEGRLMKQVLEYMELLNVVISQIHTLTNADYMDLLFKKYVEYKPLDRIAREMDFNESYLRKMHVKALRSFQESVLDPQDGHAAALSDSAI